MCVAILFVFAVLILFIVMMNSSNKEHFNPPVNSCYNACGSPCSVLPPQWIGNADQGNGILGEDHLSGFNFYSAY